MKSAPKKRNAWVQIGYGLTGMWMVIILFVTNNDPSDPLFNFIFVVPIAGWCVAILIVHLLRSRK